MEFQELQISTNQIDRITKLVENYSKIYDSSELILKELEYANFYTEEALNFAHDLLEFQSDRPPLNSDRYFQGTRYYYDTVSKKYSAPSLGLYNYTDPSLLKAKILQLVNKKNEIKDKAKFNKRIVKNRLRESVASKEFISNLKNIKDEYFNSLVDETINNLKNYFLESEYAFNEKEAIEMLEALDSESFNYFLKEYKTVEAKKKAKSILTREIPPSDSAIPYSTKAESKTKTFCEKCNKNLKECGCSSKEDKETLEDDKDSCWQGWTQYGMKKKGGKLVPNCLKTQKEDIDEAKDYHISPYNKNLYYMQPDGSYELGGDGRTEGKTYEELKKLGKLDKIRNKKKINKGFEEEIEEVEEDEQEIEEVNLSVGRGEKRKDGSLTKKGRDRYNRETNSNLKAPVTSDNPSPSEAARRKSFCARSKSWIPDGGCGSSKTRGCEARRNWRC